MAAYLTMRSWTDDTAPPAFDDPQAQLPLDGAWGVHITLRRFGRPVGSAFAIQGRDGPNELLARRAIGRALARTLGDPAVTSLPYELRDTIGTGLTLELDVAGQLEPMLGRSYDRLARNLDPGIDGIAMRLGDQWAALFPSQLIASNTANRIATRLPALAAELGLPPRDLDALIREHGLSVYRFRTLHLVQTDPRAFPFESIRGDVLVHDEAVTVQGIANFADGIASHLLGKIHDGEDADDPDLAPDSAPTTPALGLLGDYHPVADTYRPLTAPLLDQALVSFALSRFAAAPHVNTALAEQAHLEAGRLLRDVHHTLDAEPMNPALAAGVIYAVSAYLNAAPDAEADAVLSELADAAATAIAETQIEQVRTHHAQALVAGAAARLLVSNDRTELDAAAVRNMLDSIWQTVPEHQYVALLPWIGWAELDYAHATGNPLAHADQLRQIRNVLEASRVTNVDPDAAPDFYGGFALADSAGSFPTAQVTRPAVFLATMLRENDLTAEDEQSPQLGWHLQTMRFLMQLGVRQQTTWPMRNPGRALGGIRAAPFDLTMPNAAQAMALLTAVETLQSLQYIAAR